MAGEALWSRLSNYIFDTRGDRSKQASLKLLLFGESASEEFFMSALTEIANSIESQGSSCRPCSEGNTRVDAVDPVFGASMEAARLCWEHSQDYEHGGEL